MYVIGVTATDLNGALVQVRGADKNAVEFYYLGNNDVQYLQAAGTQYPVVAFTNPSTANDPVASDPPSIYVSAVNTFGDQFYIDPDFLTATSEDVKFAGYDSNTLSAPSPLVPWEVRELCD